MKFLVLLVVSLVAAVSAGRSLVSLATKQDLKDAISKGSPIWNHGDIQGCVDLYTAAAQKHAAAEPVLAAALEAMKGQATDTQGWTLRKAMDAVLRMATTMDSPGAAAASAASTPALPVSEVVTDIEDGKSHYTIRTCTHTRARAPCPPRHRRPASLRRHNAPTCAQMLSHFSHSLPASLQPSLNPHPPL